MTIPLAHWEIEGASFLLSSILTFLNIKNEINPPSLLKLYASLEKSDAMENKKIRMKYTSWIISVMLYWCSIDFHSICPLKILVSSGNEILVSLFSFGNLSFHYLPFQAKFVLNRLQLSSTLSANFNWTNGSVENDIIFGPWVSFVPMCLS